MQVTARVAPAAAPRTAGMLMQPLLLPGVVAMSGSSPLEAVTVRDHRPVRPQAPGTGMCVGHLHGACAVRYLLVAIPQTRRLNRSV